MSGQAKSDKKLASLNEKRDHVKGQMSAAWDKPLPDMPALEILHYELKNLEYRIATHEPEDDSQVSRVVYRFVQRDRQLRGF